MAKAVTELAEELGVSEEAVEMARTFDFVDLHLDAHIPIRLFGTDIRARHGMGSFRGYCFGHFDIPRGMDGGLNGAMWSITTNPFNTRSGRWRALLSNLEQLRSIVDASAGRMRIVRSLEEYQVAKSRGAFACIPSVQGANCLDGALGGPMDVPDGLLVRATLMHLTHSRIGATSGPWSWRSNQGLSAYGRALVERMNEARVFVDLAHAHPQTFWEAMDAHAPGLPVLSTHTGVDGVRPLWRNLDDEQLRAIANTGGVVGIIYSSYFLVPPGQRSSGEWVIQHLEHAINVAGEEHVGIGSDHDGFIIPPQGLRSADQHPQLVQYMLDAKWSPKRIERVLGQNFLRALGDMRPTWPLRQEAA